MKENGANLLLNHKKTVPLVKWKSIQPFKKGRFLCTFNITVSFIYHIGNCIFDAAYPGGTGLW